jgi:hypothetical protein
MMEATLRLIAVWAAVYYGINAHSAGGTTISIFYALVLNHCYCTSEPSTLYTTHLRSSNVLSTAVVAIRSGAAASAASLWQWPVLPVHRDLPSVPQTLTWSILHVNGSRGQLLEAVAEFRDVASLVLALCDGGRAADTCNLDPELAWIERLLAIVTAPVTGLGPVVDLYPLASCAAVTRASQILTGTSPSPRTASETLRAEYLRLPTRLIHGGSRFNWVRRPEPEPVPYPFPSSPYLDLLKQVLVNTVYQDDSLTQTMDTFAFDPSERGFGAVWPSKCCYHLRHLCTPDCGFPCFHAMPAHPCSCGVRP